MCICALLCNYTGKRFHAVTVYCHKRQINPFGTGTSLLCNVMHALQSFGKGQ